MWDLFKENMKRLGVEREFADELRTGIQLQMVRADREQRKLAEAARRRRFRTVDGIGDMQMVMTPFHAALAKIQFGPNWRGDKAQVKDLLRKHPEFKVERERKAMVTVLKPA